MMEMINENTLHRNLISKLERQKDILVDIQLSWEYKDAVLSVKEFPIWR